jgi:hypothetical protein
MALCCTQSKKAPGRTWTLRQETRDGSVSEYSAPAAKVSNPNFEEKSGNSPDISKGISQSGMCKFESSQVRVRVEFEPLFERPAAILNYFVMAITLYCGGPR